MDGGGRPILASPNGLPEPDWTMAGGLSGLIGVAVALLFDWPTKESEAVVACLIADSTASKRDGCSINR